MPARGIEAGWPRRSAARFTRARCSAAARAQTGELARARPEDLVSSLEFVGASKSLLVLFTHPGAVRAAFCLASSIRLKRITKGLQLTDICNYHSEYVSN